LLAPHLARLVAERTLDAIVPVPLHPLRLCRRGFNQALSLARAARTGPSPPLLAGALRRRRHTPSQAELLGPRERIANVRGAFVVPRRSERAVAGRRILLVDDVLTTGATAEACARALLDAGAERIDVLTLACAVP
jgi:ComF family protein